MRSETHEVSPVRCDRSVCIEGAEQLQELDCLRVRAGGRRVEPTQLHRIAHTPRCELERERRQVGLDDFRRTVSGKSCMLRLTPQAIAHACFEPTRSAAALL